MTMTSRNMSDNRLHLIADCLSEEWIGAWAGEGVCQVEEYLAKHAAFEAFLGDGDDS
jgi:hypothetical protein